MEIEGITWAVADKLRLRIVVLLWDSSLCVKCMVAALNAPQSTISHHLGALKKTTIVKKDIVTTFYSELAGSEPFRSDFKNREKHSTGCDVECKIYCIDIKDAKHAQSFLEWRTP